jgi:hypothetical protein
LNSIPRFFYYAFISGNFILPNPSFVKIPPLSPSFPNIISGVSSNLSLITYKVVSISFKRLIIELVFPSFSFACLSVFVLNSFGFCCGVFFNAILVV